MCTKKNGRAKTTLPSLSFSLPRRTRTMRTKIRIKKAANGPSRDERGEAEERRFVCIHVATEWLVRRGVKLINGEESPPLTPRRRRGHSSIIVFYKRPDTAFVFAPFFDSTSPSFFTVYIRTAKRPSTDASKHRTFFSGTETFSLHFLIAKPLNTGHSKQRTLLWQFNFYSFLS